MATYGYSTPYTGRGDAGPLPPGYMEAATAPGRNLAMGIAAMGQGLGKAIEQYRTKKAETEAADQSRETLVGLYQQQLASDPKYIAIQQYTETGQLPQGVTEQDIPRYTQQVQADREMLNKFSNVLGEKFVDMSLTKKKAALGDAVMVLNQYRTDQQNQLRDQATRQQLKLSAIQLGQAERDVASGPILAQAYTDLAASTSPNASLEVISKYGSKLDPKQIGSLVQMGEELSKNREYNRRLQVERNTNEAISQIANLPTSQTANVEQAPAYITSSLNIPSAVQPYTPFYQVQQVMGGQQQQPEVATWAQGLGRPVSRIPQRIPIADQPLTPAPAPQPPVSTQRVPLRDKQVLQQQQAARPVGIAPIPSREAPLFESSPIRTTAQQEQEIPFQDRFKQATQIFQRMGVPLNVEAINKVIEATGTPRPIQVDTKTLPGGITVVRADGKVDIIPAPKMVEGKDLTEGQAASLGYASRLSLNEKTLNEVAGRGYKPGGLFEFGFTPQRLMSEDRKVYDAAKSNWIAAKLRKESGAVISDKDYNDADLQYFPQPGDTAKVLKQKAELRKNVFLSERAGIGRFADDYLNQVSGGQFRNTSPSTGAFRLVPGKGIQPIQ